MSSALTYENTRKIVTTADYEIQINEAGEGHPVFLIHGMGPGATGWSNFAPNIPELSKSFRCIAVTMPGWGESSPQTPETGRNQSEAMKQLMDVLEIERAAFVGNSMGGGISMVMGGKYPDRVSHIVTMGAGLYGPAVNGPGGIPEGIKALIDTYADPSPENFKRVVSTMCYDDRFATDELAAERSRGALEHAEHLKNWRDVGAAGVGLEDFLQLGSLIQGMEIPSLLIHGRDDRTVHFEASLRAMSLIPNSRVVLLNHCGHWAQLEHADEFNRLVIDFVNNN